MQNIVTNIAPNTTETATPTALRPAPGRSTSANPIWVAEADGIWRNTKAKQKWLYERPIIRGKETFKALGTKRLKLAKEEFARRITLRAQGTEPTEKASKATTAGAVIRLYIDADYPDKMLKPKCRNGSSGWATGIRSVTTPLAMSASAWTRSSCAAP